MPMARPCIDCHKPTILTRCPECARGKSRPAPHGSSYQTAEWRKLSKQARQRDQGECTLCGSTNRVGAHHRIHRREGGPDTLENLISLCASCHRKAHAFKDIDQFLKDGAPDALRRNERHGRTTL